MAVIQVIFCARHLVRLEKSRKSTREKCIYLGRRIGTMQQIFDHYTQRFVDIVSETMRTIQAINAKYSVLRPEQFHP
jgi:hypothetical protein